VKFKKEKHDAKRNFVVKHSAMKQTQVWQKRLKIMENTHTQQTANKGIRARFANE